MDADLADAALVHDLLRASAARQPDAVALIDAGRAVTYDALETRANRFANVLREAGVGRHDRVVIALDNGLDFVACYVGTLRTGAVAVPLPAGPRSDRLQSAIADCMPVACVVDRATAGTLAPGSPLARVPVLFSTGPRTPAAGVRSLEESLASAASTPPAARVIDVDLAAIIYTSGSTGEPRGVMLSHRNILANTRSIVRYLELTSRDRVMCVLPFYYVYGLSLLHTHLAVGGSIVIDNRFAFPNLVLSAMREHKATGFAGVPSTFAVLLTRSTLSEMTFPDLRYVTQAGGGMAPAKVLEWLEHGPRVPFYIMYGATEASARLTYLPPSEVRRKLGSIGRPIPNVEIVVITDDGAVAGVHEIGELVARGANISSGYWNDPEETAAKFGPSGYRTGDLGYVDDEGFLFLVGRKHDMIKVGAHRVGAKEIEDVLHEHRDVAEAAVIGTPHDILGEAPAAFIVLREGAPAGRMEIQAFCRERLAAHKVPVTVTVVPEIPKTPGVGKTDKRALAASLRANS
jgi:amino acid adenylation domain-containing protein